MDDIAGSPRRTGGIVEPLQRAAIARQTFQTPTPPAAVRYELRDPFADVTYRTSSREEMVAKAEQLQTLRFIEIQPDGKRTTISRDGDRWSSAAERTASLARDSAATPTAARPVALATEILARVDTDAERRARTAAIEASLHERYLIRRAPLRIGDVSIGQTEYRHRGDTSRVAFTESTFKLSTDTNSPSVARSMVDVAEARNWQSLRISGNDDFRRMVWLEASLRGVKTIGYEALPSDRDALQKARQSRQVNQVEPAPLAPTGEGASAKQSARGGGRKAVLVALEALLVQRKVPERQRIAVMAAAADNLAQRLQRGESHRIKVFDREAPVQRPPAAPRREPQRVAERNAPAR